MGISWTLSSTRESNMETKTVIDRTVLQAELLDDQGQWVIVCRDLKRKHGTVNFGELAGLQEGYAPQKIRVVERRTTVTVTVLMESPGI